MIFDVIAREEPLNLGGWGGSVFDVFDGNTAVSSCLSFFPEPGIRV